mmetsp:Transcript_15189/g.19031  ORF Transcript_15189/g.19031 Transcript_15189/m.19031 type:complete len:104 (+) Transcript_15189:832-1143(+)
MKTSVIDKCGGIATRAKNAQVILSDLLKGLVSNPVSLVEKIIEGKLGFLFNQDACKKAGKEFSHSIRDAIFTNEKISKQLPRTVSTAMKMSLSSSRHKTKKES